MKKILFFILWFVGANCSSISLIDNKDIRESDQFCQLNNKLLTELQNSVDRVRKEQNETSSTVDQLSADLAEIKKLMKDLHNQSSSNSEILASISKDLQKAHVVQLSEENNETLSILNATDCKDVLNSGKKVSTSYLLPKFNRTVNCDMETDGGGWLVIQQRKQVTKQVDFNTTWDSYKEGFGDLDTEFWIGNEFLHQVTKNKSYELRIDMEDFEKGHFLATYSEFRVGNEESGYQLHVGGYEGNIRDTFQRYHNNMKFSTFDRDNERSSQKCAEKHSGGFWYNICILAYLNGLYPTVPDRKNEKLIRWWHNNEWLVFINVEMKIRPKQKQKIAV